MKERLCDLGVDQAVTRDDATLSDRALIWALCLAATEYENANTEKTAHLLWDAARRIAELVPTQ